MSLIIEIIVGLLLLATCGYCYVLSRKLHEIRQGQAELLTVIEKFDVASRRAEESLATIRTTGQSMGRELAQVSERANILLDELSVMVQAGDHIAGRIETVVKDVRTIGARRGKSDGRFVS